MKKNKLWEKVSELEHDIENLKEKINELEDEKAQLLVSIDQIKKIRLAVTEDYRANHKAVINELSKTNRELTIIAAELKKPAK